LLYFFVTSRDISVVKELFTGCPHFFSLILLYAYDTLFFDLGVSSTSCSILAIQAEYEG
jgi:hypothetical protein